MCTLSVITHCDIMPSVHILSALSSRVTNTDNLQVPWMLFNAGLDLLVYWIEAAPLSRKSCLKCCHYNAQKSHQ